MKCNCEESCIKTKEELLSEIGSLYESCSNCNTKTLKKAIPLKRQIKLEKIDENFRKCSICSKRHIDIVMAHVLKILIENEQIIPTASIRKVGTPLITPAINLGHLPYLSEKTLVIITTSCDKTTADKIIKNVPEIKAIIRGDTNNTVGMLNEKSEIHNYELLSGCDIRCDIQNTDAGQILLYKQQSKIHIEYPKAQSPKIQQLSKILDKYEEATLLDAMCGPGTLGIYAIRKNNAKVIFNDIYEESINNLKVNLEVNNIKQDSYKIFNENIIDLVDKIDMKFDIGLIDTFPNEDTSKYVNALKKVCDKVITI